MKPVDVIGIGGINYDYMFQCQKVKSNTSEPDDGREMLYRSINEVEEDIRELYKTSKTYTTQIGGSALLALKTIHAIDKSLSIGFVGVCGQISKFEEEYGNNLNIESELSFIDNKTWLFRAKDYQNITNKNINKSVVRLGKHHTRGNIKVSVGANDYLLDLIQEKENKENISFSDFLSQAKWVHISSLNKFGDFKKIIKYVTEAKMQNRFLRVSIDPGSQYTEDKRTELKECLRIADYVFLSENEYKNLIVNQDLPNNEKHIKLSAYLNNPQNVDTKVFVVKHNNRHELIDFINGTPYVHYHMTIPNYKINNDTGAGDCFAGGFIAGLLSDRLIAQQPAPISLGALASRTRMIADTNGMIFKNIESESEKFFKKKYQHGELNRWQRIRIFFNKHSQFIFGFISSLVITLIIRLLGSMVDLIRYLISLI